MVKIGLPVYLSSGVNEGPHLSINIDGNISKSQLIKFITSKWKFIESKISATKKFPKFTASAIDFLIIELRDDEKQTFLQISDYLSAHNLASLDENAVRQRYARCKNQIENLISN